MNIIDGKVWTIAVMKPMVFPSHCWNSYYETMGHNRGFFFFGLFVRRWKGCPL
jgi:hypothetical protein